MVCVRNGRPIAVFSDSEAGDRWLTENTEAVETVYMLEDGKPRGKSVTDPAANHRLRLQADGQVAQTA